MSGRRLAWGMEQATAEELTIDELARRTGMTVRNIRAHQSRGLLPPPQVRGRTGFYGPDHESRIELIRELQADGFKLEAIGRLLDSAGGSSDEVLRFTRAVKAPFEDEQPQIVSAEELAERWGAGDAAPALLRKAEKLGILRPLPDGNFEELSPRLGQASAELAALGIPPETALDVAAELRKHSDAVAKTFVELFIRQVWQPFEDQGRPEHDLPAVRDAVERLRPLASDALLAMFQLVMTEASRTGSAARSSGSRSASAEALSGRVTRRPRPAAARASSPCRARPGSVSAMNSASSARELVRSLELREVAHAREQLEPAAGHRLVRGPAVIGGDDRVGLAPDEQRGHRLGQVEPVERADALAAGVEHRAHRLDERRRAPRRRRARRSRARPRPCRCPACRRSRPSSPADRLAGAEHRWRA